MEKEIQECGAVLDHQILRKTVHYFYQKMLLTK